jgi:predicted Fe-S protein YdhL (DUF1289 family)
MPPAIAVVESPCIKVCQLNAGQVCTGCGRTIDEIAQWSGANASQQRQIVAAARQRLAIIGRPADAATPNLPHEPDPQAR